MKRILIVIAISLFLCSTASAAQGGGGESTKKKPVTKPNSSTPPRPPTPPVPAVQYQSIDLGNGVKLELVLINAGTFQMGGYQNDDEQPQHRVKISQPFYLGKYEVTQAQWQAVMGTNVALQQQKANATRPLVGVGDNYPMYYVNWYEAQEFLNRLNALNYGFTYRLPTEAEWEYTARAGMTGSFSGNLDAMAWYGNNSGNSRLDVDEIFRDDRSNYLERLTDNANKTHPVGTKQPNAWGLYDMHGNVLEWCQDWAVEYSPAPVVDPSGPANGQNRIVRGGSFFTSAAQARSAYRLYSPPGLRPNNLGIRVVAVARTP